MCLGLSVTLALKSGAYRIDSLMRFMLPRPTSNYWGLPLPTSVSHKVWFANAPMDSAILIGFRHVSKKCTLSLVYHQVLGDLVWIGRRTGHAGHGESQSNKQHARKQSQHQKRDPFTKQCQQVATPCAIAAWQEGIVFWPTRLACGVLTVWNINWSGLPGEPVPPHPGNRFPRSYSKS